LCSWIDTNLLQKSRCGHERELESESKRERESARERDRARHNYRQGRGARGWHIKGRVGEWAFPCNSAGSRLQGNFVFSSLLG
jgi:hypothetical protein